MSSESTGVEANDIRLFGGYDGVVASIDDPKGLGRVRVTIPGVAAPTPWALPVGTFGGSNRRGLFCVPPVGSLVWVQFNQGDPQQPRYMGGYWGGNVEGASDDGGRGSEVPERIRDAEISDRPRITVLETERWAIVMDDREAPTDEDGEPTIDSEDQDTFIILHKPTGQTIEIDGGRRGIVIRGDTIQIIAEGALVLDGLTVSIAGRKVRKDAGLMS